jgi:hypothetical protein
VITIKVIVEQAPTPGVLDLLRTINRKLDVDMSQISDVVTALSAKVGPLTDAVGALDTVLTSILDQVATAPDLASLQAMIPTLQANTEHLVAMALRGTPSAPPNLTVPPIAATPAQVAAAAARR